MNEVVEAHLGPRYRADAPPPALPAAQARVRDALLSERRPSDWEDAACLCGASGGRVLSDVDRYGLAYRKVLCTECGLLRVTPRWTMERYGRFYRDAYRDLYSPLSDTSDGATLRTIAAGPSAAMV